MLVSKELQGEGAVYIHFNKLIINALLSFYVKLIYQSRKDLTSTFYTHIMCLQLKVDHCHNCLLLIRIYRSMHMHRILTLTLIYVTLWRD